MLTLVLLVVGIGCFFLLYICTFISVLLFKNKLFCKEYDLHFQVPYDSLICGT